MWHTFQVESWAKLPSGNDLLCIMAKGKLENVMEKDFKRKTCIISILFMKLKENRIKGRWKVIDFMGGGNWRKMKKLEASILKIH